MEKKRALTHIKAAFSTALLAVLGFFAFDVDFYQPKTLAASSLMAGITVNSTAQSPGANGDCTLGEAIQAANSNAAVDGCSAGSSTEPDVIQLPAGTYTLDSVYSGPAGNANGLPGIESNITIQGDGSGSTIIERSTAAGTPEFRFFFINPNGLNDPNIRLTLNDVTLRGGRTGGTSGGAIYVQSLLFVNNCILADNRSSGRDGGAIGTHFGYSAAINNSTFSGNSANSGGAIQTGDGPLTITNSTFSNNTATAGSGGALSLRRDVTISGSRFTNNTASNGGGAISKGQFSEPVIVSNSIFTGNTVTVGGSNGGAVSATNITLTDSTVSGNTTTGEGGGIWSNNPTIIQSTISGNTADYGGGLGGHNLTISNSTISGNFARESGGGILFGGNSSVLNINNATITNNLADSDNNGSGTGGGMHHTYSFSASTSKYIRNSIIAGNTTGAIGNNSASDCADAYGAVWQSQGFNLIGNNAGCNFTAATGDQVGTPGQPIDPLLGTLQNNGGATQTHALLANSPAIDTANPATPDGTGNSCLPTDQRIAAIRPGDGDGNGTPRCDIGAFEVVELIPTRLVFSVQPANRIAGQIFNPAIQIEIQDQFGILMPNETADVTIALGNDPGGGTLSGTLTRTTVSGIATFDDVYLNRVGTGYTLQASAANLSAATSSAFNITPGAASQLAFETQPVNTPALATITPAVKVSVQDAFGNLVTTQSKNITISIGNNAGNGTLSGNLSSNTGSSGFVTFNSLSINQPGSDYSLQAAATGLPSIPSSAFDIVRPIFVVTKTADTSDGTCNSDCSLREAIAAANAMNGADTINFNIPGTSPFTIALSSTLPDISSPVTIDGKTQSGYANSPIVGINGSAIGQSANGLKLGAGSNTIQGLLVGGFGSTNTSHAIRISSNNNLIRGNYIGTDFTGNSSLPNSIGIGTDSGSTGNIIGGTATADRNVISGNTVAGIRIVSSGNTIQGNYTGRNASNNGAVGNGVGIQLLSGSSTNAIGGTAPGAGNIIFGNTSGITFSDTAATKNSIRGNSIYGHSGVGIVLSKNSPTRNDPNDPDAGPNNLQNYPILNFAVSTNGNTNVRGTFNGTRSSTFTLEFFSNQNCGASGYGEGRTLLGTTSVTTDGTGITSFSVDFATTVTIGHFITATATDALGSTSEFSECEQVGSGISSISGRLSDSNNFGLNNQRVGLSGERTATTVTDRDGNYSFADLPVGNYTVAPIPGNYSFSPQHRIYTGLNGDQTNQDFVGTRSSYAVTVVVKANRAGSLYALGQVNLTVSGSASQTRESDANGKSIFSLPPSGNYVITPSLANYGFNPPNITLPNPLTSDLTIDFTAQLQTPLLGRFVMSNGSWAYTANADGSGLTQLSSLGSGNQYLDISRDGSRIVFPNLSRLYAANYDGVGSTALTTDTSGTVSYPRWSPDKTKIAFVRQQGSSTQARVLNVADGTTANIPAGRARRTWSPDAAKIAFERRFGYTSEIFSADLDGTNETQLTNDASGYNTEPDWSPDGTKIVYVRSDRQLKVMNADGSNKITLYTLMNIDSRIINPVWSPDGNKIAFVQPDNLWSTAEEKGLFVINADGNGLRKLSNSSYGSLSWGAEYQVPTPQGANVPIQSGGVSLNFAGIGGAGQTTVSPIPPNSAGMVQGSFQIYGVAYEISTTANYTPPVTVCFSQVPYDSEAHFNTLALLHNEGGTLVDRTISRNFAAKQICGSVNSLSPFALAEQIDISKPQISGLVLDSNGDPMSGVQMSLTGAETKETETNTDGTFRFVNLIAGTNYNVQPKQLGYVFNSYSQDFVNLSGEQTVVFSGTAAGFGISGRVTDSNGNGISNVVIELSKGVIAQTATDAAGNYTFPNLPADGSYAVRAFDGINSFGPSETTIGPLLANVTDVDFAQFAPSAAMVHISGRIMTADGRGITNATVTLTESDGSSRNAVSSSFGYFRFEDVAAGQNVIVGVRAKRFVFTQPNVILNIQDSVLDIDFTAEPN